MNDFGEFIWCTEASFCTAAFCLCWYVGIGERTLWWCTELTSTFASSARAGAEGVGTIPTWGLATELQDMLEDVAILSVSCLSSIFFLFLDFRLAFFSRFLSFFWRFCAFLAFFASLLSRRFLSCFVSSFDKQSFFFMSLGCTSKVVSSDGAKGSQSWLSPDLLNVWDRSSWTWGVIICVESRPLDLMDRWMNSPLITTLSASDCSYNESKCKHPTSCSEPLELLTLSRRMIWVSDLRISSFHFFLSNWLRYMAFGRRLLWKEGLNLFREATPCIVCRENRRTGPISISGLLISCTCGKKIPVVPWNGLAKELILRRCIPFINGITELLPCNSSLGLSLICCCPSRRRFETIRVLEILSLQK